MHGVWLTHSWMHFLLHTAFQSALNIQDCLIWSIKSIENMVNWVPVWTALINYWIINYYVVNNSFQALRSDFKKLTQGDLLSTEHCLVSWIHRLNPPTHWISEYNLKDLILVTVKKAILTIFVSFYKPTNIMRQESNWQINLLWKH